MFLGGKGGHFHVPIVMKSGSLNLPETYEIVQTFTGTALPLPLHINTIWSRYTIFWEKETPNICVK
jgi:hypothetical protein